MLPHVVAALLLAQSGVHASRVDARVACDTIHSPVVDGPGEVAQVAPGENGRVAWTDAFDSRKVASVLVRDARGQIRVVGKRGEGPGEFVAVSKLSWRGDTLWVSDARLRRMQAFSSTGKFLAAHPLRVGGGFAATTGGSLMGWNNIPPPAAAGPTKISVELVPFALIRVQNAESPADTFYRFFPTMSKNQSGATSLVQRTIPAGNSNGDTWCVVGATEESGLQVACLDLNGKILFRRVQQFPARPVTDAVWDSALTFYTKYSPRAEVQQMLHRAKDLPPAFALAINRNGDIWIGRSHPSESKQIWDRMRRDGTALPSITFNSRAQLRALDGAWYYAVVTDADDLQTLIRCAIP